MPVAHHIVIVGGCGHVGLPLGIVLATRTSARIDLLDVDPNKVDQVNSGKMPCRRAVG
jgi:UDP-N-acetyl-D-mannosaminuronic acid dehydrogenase